MTNVEGIYKKAMEFADNAEGMVISINEELIDVAVDLEELMSYVSEGIYVTDTQGKTLYVNKTFTKFSGLSKEFLVGKSIVDLERDGFFKNTVTSMVLRTKQRVDSVAEVLSNGKKFLLTGNPVFDTAGNVVRVITSSRNVTDLINLSDELADTKEKMKVFAESIKKNEGELNLLRNIQRRATLIGESNAILQVEKMVKQIAQLETTVLITGETGTGKEVIANEIYKHSGRNSSTFIRINCAAIPANLLESELFGYEKGAFTGANTSGKIGMFELANNGTLLLDEIGDMPIELQPKLLRTIQQKEVFRIGGTKPIKLNVRILASTNRDLKKMVAEGKFREDLYYRLSVFPINIPPLRGRVEDIIPLANNFLSKYNAKYNKYIEIDKTGLDSLKKYLWPGNIRELANIIERLVIVSDGNAVVDGYHISDLLGLEFYNSDMFSGEMGLRDMVIELERRSIEKAMTLSDNTRQAAGKLKMEHSTFIKKAQRLGIDLKRR